MSEQNKCDVHLHAEIDVLNQALLEKQNQLIAMETACLRESDRQVELEDSIIAWQDKYDRLYESHKRVQKVNQSLEDKLLKLVDRNSNERAQLTSDVATLSVRLAQANYNIAKLQREIERYKTDINLAIQLLQCKPDSFVPQKVSSLPNDIQSKVSSYMRLETASHSDSEDNTSGVGVATSNSYKVLPASDSPPPVCPFPPTAMVYSMRGVDAPISDCNNTSSTNNNNSISSNNNNNSTDQMISPSIIAKYLEDELKSNEIKHCDTCQCTNDLTVLADEPKNYTVSTQTINFGDNNTALCLRCNSNLNSPSRTNSPFIMKLLKSSDSIISETKSSVSDLNDGDHKIFIPAKKDDLMVNPILGHHRLCDRTVKKIHHIQQKQHLNDTAKYFLDTHRKTNRTNDLIDLRKFTDKSGNSNDFLLNSNEGITRILPNELHIQNDSKRKSDNLRNGIKKDVIQGKNKSDNNGNNNVNIDKKIDRNLSCGEKLGSLQTAISGSVTSLWSKNSDSEGAKLFETFNRNLIKTIKSDNPKHRGPRLCAMRIQSNGSSNILLDNIESEVTPVVYTRRPRFLDEELDDTKDIITSKTSVGLGQQQNHIIALPSSTEHQILNLQQNCQSNSTIIDMNNICTSTFNGHENIQHENNNNDITKSFTTNQQNDTKLIIFNNNNNNNQFTNKQYLDQEINRQNFFNNDQEEHHGHKNINYDMINLNNINENFNNGVICGVGGNSSCQNSKTTCTQSSSISEIDLQESALLRRQQLNRVAEWVQNNSKIEIEQKKELQHQTKQLQENPKINQHNTNHIDCTNNFENKNYCLNDQSINICNQYDNSIIIQQQQNCSPNYLEKLSNDSGYKTTNNNNNNVICNNNNIIVGQILADKIINSNNYHNNYQSDLIAQNNFTFNQYNNNNNNKIIEKIENEFINKNCIIDQQQLQHQQQQKSQKIHQTNVDLAQMEYNVKQFLLKQNEWSIQNLNNNNYNQYQHQQQSPSSSNMSSGITCGDGGPGSSNDGIINNSGQQLQTPDLIASNNFYLNHNNNDSCHIYVQNPHRTETNL